MIRIVLLGRSGNHLFQYALGRVLARRHQVPLVLDGSWFNAAGWSEVSHLLRLPLRAKVVRRASLAARALLKLTGKHYWEYRGVPVIREPATEHAFNPAFLAAPADCVIMGYFQSYRYFESIADELRAELLGLLDGVVPADAPAADVAVHVRRTDFLQHRDFQVCDPTYHDRAMDRMRELVPGARFTVFSDDPDWCSRHFREPDTEIASPPDASRGPLYDLLRMSRARHHIIANSSYSWWAAWLGKKDGQQVLMPDAWFRSGSIHAPIQDKRCPGWELVPASGGA